RRCGIERDFTRRALARVHTDVHRNPANPGGEPRVAPEGAQPAMHADEHVLRDVLHQAAIRYRSGNDGEHHSLVLVDQLAERGVAAGPAAIDEITIRGAVVQRAY